MYVLTISHGSVIGNKYEIEYPLLAVLSCNLNFYIVQDFNSTLYEKLKCKVLLKWAKYCFSRCDQQLFYPKIYHENKELKT